MIHFGALENKSEVVFTNTLIQADRLIKVKSQFHKGG